MRSEVNVDTKQDEDSARESDDEMQSESEGDSDEEESEEEEEEEGMSQFSNGAMKTKDVLYTRRGAENVFLSGTIDSDLKISANQNLHFVSPPLWISAWVF